MVELLELAVQKDALLYSPLFNLLHDLAYFLCSFASTAKRVILGLLLVKVLDKPFLFIKVPPHILLPHLCISNHFGSENPNNSIDFVGDLSNLGKHKLLTPTSAQVLINNFLSSSLTNSLMRKNGVQI